MRRQFGCALGDRYWAQRRNPYRCWLTTSTSAEGNPGSTSPLRLRQLDIRSGRMRPELDGAMNHVHSERELAKIGIRISSGVRGMESKIKQIRRKRAVTATGAAIGSVGVMLVAVYGSALASSRCDWRHRRHLGRYPRSYRIYAPDRCAMTHGITSGRFLVTFGTISDYRSVEMRRCSARCGRLLLLLDQCTWSDLKLLVESPLFPQLCLLTAASLDVSPHYTYAQQASRQWV